MGDLRMAFVRELCSASWTAALAASTAEPSPGPVWPHAGNHTTAVWAARPQDFTGKLAPEKLGGGDVVWLRLLVCSQLDGRLSPMAGVRCLALLR